MLAINHKPECRCWRCAARVLGNWLDRLGETTEAKHWNLFVTLTYSTPTYPWKRGFPALGHARPTADFGHRFFAFFISYLESRVGSDLDFVVADQYGDVNGRFHQHALLAGKGVECYPRRAIQQWLRCHAGFARVLPFEHGAAHYVARYIGRDVRHTEWDFRIGNEESARPYRSKNGGHVVATSAELPRGLFHQTLPRRHR